MSEPMDSGENPVAEPAVPEGAKPEEPTRRGALMWLTVFLGGLASVAAGIPIVGFLLAPALRKQVDDWVDAGGVQDIPENETRLVDLPNPLATSADGLTGKVAVYVRNLGGDEFAVFSVHCTHLGCPVNWFSESGLFMCPCHGGVYYEDGARASGPPPRGLYQLPHRVENGKLQVKVGHLPTLDNPA